MSAFLAYLPNIEAASCTQLDPWTLNFYGVIDYVIQSTKVETFGFLARFVSEI